MITKDVPSASVVPEATFNTPLFWMEANAVTTPPVLKIAVPPVLMVKAVSVVPAFIVKVPPVDTVIDKPEANEGATEIVRPESTFRNPAKFHATLVVNPPWVWACHVIP